MNKLIKILKDTPFHKADTELSIIDFRAAYGWICTNTTTNEQLIKYIESEHKTIWNTSKPPAGKEYQLLIGEWFQVIEKFEEEPLVFVHEDLWYVKDFDGMYAVFINPMMYKEYIDYKRTQSACIKKIHIQEARKLIAEAKFKKQILYCTNDVNKKL
jgi:hypothetical protein